MNDWVTLTLAALCMVIGVLDVIYEPGTVHGFQTYVLGVLLIQTMNDKRD